MLLQSIPNFFSNIANRQKDSESNKQTKNATKNIVFLAVLVI